VVVALALLSQLKNVLNVGGRELIETTLLVASLIRYFAQTDAKGSIYMLHRLRQEADHLYPEVWSERQGEWLYSDNVIKLWIGGDCTLEQISPQVAQNYLKST
jgi:hypothetical protein